MRAWRIYWLAITLVEESAIEGKPTITRDRPARIGCSPGSTWALNRPNRFTHPRIPLRFPRPAAAPLPASRRPTRQLVSERETVPPTKTTNIPADDSAVFARPTAVEKNGIGVGGGNLKAPPSDGRVAQLATDADNQRPKWVANRAPIVKIAGRPSSPIEIIW